VKPVSPQNRNQPPAAARSRFSRFLSHSAFSLRNVIQIRKAPAWASSAPWPHAPVRILKNRSLRAASSACARPAQPLPQSTTDGLTPQLWIDVARPWRWHASLRPWGCAHSGMICASGKVQKRPSVFLLWSRNGTGFGANERTQGREAKWSEGHFVSEGFTRPQAPVFIGFVCKAKRTGVFQGVTGKRRDPAPRIPLATETVSNINGLYGVERVFWIKRRHFSAKEPA